LVIAQQMAQAGIILYAVGCEPSISSYRFVPSFMKYLSEVCSGKYVPLTDAHLLAKVITGGCREEINLYRIHAEVTSMIEAEKVDDTNGNTNSKLDP
jgi:hypothetical protein